MFAAVAHLRYVPDSAVMVLPTPGPPASRMTSPSPRTVSRASSKGWFQCSVACKSQQDIAAAQKTMADLDVQLKNVVAQLDAVRPAARELLLVINDR